MDQMDLGGGFQDTGREAAIAFRRIMNAMARPGRIETMEAVSPPGPLSPAAGAVILTLCDPETGLHLASSHERRAVRDWVTFHTGAPLVDAEVADFVVGDWPSLDHARLPIGLPEYPDRSATVIVEMPEITNDGPRLTGPGIQNEAFLNLPEVELFVRNRALFPLGLDFIFTAGSKLAAMPRSTIIGAAQLEETH
ncbi:MAG: phosphonate C-P lyase system protein PhnH [Pseudomonadota bacterium]